MRLGVRKKKEGEIEFGLIYGVIALLAILAATLLPAGTIVPNCPFKEIVHVPCPTCGMTRMLRSLGQGELLAAFTWNPLAAAVLLTVLLLMAVNIVIISIRSPRPFLVLTPREKKVSRFLGAASILLNWLFLLHAGR